MTLRLRRGSRLWIAAALAAAALAAACTSSESGDGSAASTSPGSTASSPPSSQATSPAGSGTSSGSPSSTSSGSVSPAADRCRADQLQLSVGGSDGAAGTITTTFIVVNTSGSSCSLFGYPGVSYLDSSGAQVGPSAVRTTTQSPASVLLRTADAAHFLVGNSDVIPQAGCPASVTAPTMRMYPPDDTGSLTVGTSGSGGFAVCNPKVGPMRAGLSE